MAVKYTREYAEHHIQRLIPEGYVLAGFVDYLDNELDQFELTTDYLVYASSLPWLTAPGSYPLADLQFAFIGMRRIKHEEPVNVYAVVRPMTPTELLTQETPG